MEKIINKIPLWVINAISIISGIVTIISAALTIFAVYNNSSNITKLAFLSLISFIIVLFIRLRKYHKIILDRQQITSYTYHRLTHNSRDLYFDVMRSHKDKTENIRHLTETYEHRLAIILSYLCEIMGKYCGQKVSASIKLLMSGTTIEDTTLSTFCRSTKDDTDRGLYESTNKLIKLNENTDFMYILDPNNDANQNYFYQGNLKEYEKELKKNGKIYRNSNPNWENDYIGTIVVPIQIEHKRLYDSPKENSYHVIGFLCIDSKSSSAFVDRQEKFNVDMAKSFADIIYILLSQYRHYLRKMSNSTP